MAGVRAYLVADKREGEVIPHLQPLLEDRLHQHTINTGDYLICRKTAGLDETEILACIERKSIKDFASSFKDGRYHNREKMIKLREKIGCQLYWIVEGPAFPSPSWQCARGVKYQSILSAMTTLPIASGIHIIQTKDTQHTAERLRDFVLAFERVMSPYRYPITSATFNGIEEEAGSSDLVPSLVTGKYEKDPDTLCMDLWATLPGISATTAKILVGTCSISEFLTTDCLNVATFRTHTGRTLIKKGRESLLGLRMGLAPLEIKVLGGVSGISTAMATQIHASVAQKTGSKNVLRTICSWPPATLGMTQIDQKGRTIRLGDKRAEQILRLLHWKTAPETSQAGGQPEETTMPTQALNLIPATARSAEEEAAANAAAEAALEDILNS